jgi:hypothetical protein
MAEIIDLMKLLFLFALSFFASFTLKKFPMIHTAVTICFLVAIAAMIYLNIHHFLEGG